MNFAMASFNATVRQMTEMSHGQEADLPRTQNYFTKEQYQGKFAKKMKAHGLLKPLPQLK